MLQIIDGVHFIHKQGVVHLDLKPENIMCVNKTGSKIKLIDFGLARRLGSYDSVNFIMKTLALPTSQAAADGEHLYYYSALAL